ncbi:DUF86 domain-containing protein [bacterium]|nr:DUF86 domain-containing protein [bacterium]
MKDNIFFIRHIFESLELIEEFTKNFTREEFKKDEKTQAAVIEKIQIMGEAAKSVSEDLKDHYSDIPWKEMARTRDKLVHGYFSVDLDLTWDIVIKDLPGLKTNILKIIKDSE